MTRYATLCFFVIVYAGSFPTVRSSSMKNQSLSSAYSKQSLRIEKNLMQHDMNSLPKRRLGFFDWFQGATSRLNTGMARTVQRGSEASAAMANNLAHSSADMLTNGVTVTGQAASQAATASFGGMQAVTNYSSNVARTMFEPFTPVFREMGRTIESTWQATTDGVTRAWEATRLGASGLGSSAARTMRSVFGF
eukprot:Selendium_serpulae@DN5493_c0_g2_i1.p1